MLVLSQKRCFKKISHAPRSKNDDSRLPLITLGTGVDLDLQLLKIIGRTKFSTTRGYMVLKKYYYSSTRR